MSLSSTSIVSSRKRLVRIAGLVIAAIGLPGLAAAASLSVTSTLTPMSRMVALPSIAIAEAKRPLQGPCPENMAHVGTSCVDKYEASLVEVLDDGSMAPFSPYEAPNGHRVRAVSRRGVVPQGHISMNEAKRACSASGKRLCRANEWKAACKGPEETRYPYGNKRQSGVCVDTNRKSPMNLLYGGERTSRTMNDPRANQMTGTVELTGEAEACTNGYGVDDMVGNVHEWTDDGSFRGGYYLDTKLNGEGCDYRTTAHAPSYYDYSTGFRCCADEGSLTGDDT
ncbi:SUMF1/EgtB/PvdO family nonheme iron enzyme [Labilithrix luteola]|uniref:SUMF1/EgtB/PvdO family nonheme iron enzyme n=1 Tax=Labilithrix luteola TaxID=1391654 RepID=UPI0011BA949C|nr:SUMF1/EgtB/PvdO family nonheme iron enzyme [Labilithrix luteola]